MQLTRSKNYLEEEYTKCTLIYLPGITSSTWSRPALIRWPRIHDSDERRTTTSCYHWSWWTFSRKHKVWATVSRTASGSADSPQSKTRTNGHDWKWCRIRSALTAIWKTDYIIQLTRIFEQEYQAFFVKYAGVLSKCNEKHLKTFWHSPRIPSLSSSYTFSV